MHLCGTFTQLAMANYMDTSIDHIYLMFLAQSTAKGHIKVKQNVFLLHIVYKF